MSLNLAKNHVTAFKIVVFLSPAKCVLNSKQQAVVPNVNDFLVNYKQFISDFSQSSRVKQMNSHFVE